MLKHTQSFTTENRLLHLRQEKQDFNRGERHEDTPGNTDAQDAESTREIFFKKVKKSDSTLSGLSTIGRRSQGAPEFGRILTQEDAQLILRERTEKEYERIKGNLEQRISAFEKNVRSARDDVKNLSWYQTGVARMSGVLAGLQQVVEQDQRTLDTAVALLTKLEIASAVPDLHQRSRAIDLIRQQFGMSKPDYRDANAALARGSDALGSYDTLTPIPERLPFQQGQEVYALTGPESVEKGWQVERVGRDTIIVTRKGATLTVNMQQVWHIGEIEGGHALNPNVPRTVMAEMLNRKNTLLQRYARLDQEEYHRLFDGPLQQANVGNCYLIAAFESLKNSPHAEVVLRTSVQKNGDGYIVKIPLGDADAQAVTVSREEMGATKLDVPKMGQTELRPVQAAEGWVVLETAFAKKQFGSADRRNFKGGCGDQALATLLGKGISPDVVQGRDFSKPISANPAAQKRAELWLNTFARQKSITTAGTTKHKDGDTMTYTVGGQTFYHSHAYSLLAVDAENKLVLLANPHNTGVLICQTYDEFLHTFADIDNAKVDYTRMFHT